MLKDHADAYEELRHQVAQVCGRKYAFLTSSGTAAIYFVLHTLQIKGEVIIPAVVCPTVYYAVRAAGAVPVLADVRLRDLNMDPQSVSRLLSPKTEAIIPVNLFGYPAMTEEIAQLVGSTNVLLIEDAAQSIGGARFGRPLGSWKDIKRLKLTHEERLKPKRDSEGSPKRVGKRWNGAKPRFRNMRWQALDSAETSPGKSCPVDTKDYSFGYWLNGWRKSPKDTSADVLCIESGHFGFMLDVDNLAKAHFGLMDDDLDYTQALEAGSKRLGSLLLAKLADIDPALIVTPPRGMEVGYVPIATRQAMEK